MNTPTNIASLCCAHSATICSAEYGAFATTAGWKNGTHVPQQVFNEKERLHTKTLNMITNASFDELVAVETVNN